MSDEAQSLMLIEALSEMRQFNSRLMSGYEAAHRRVGDLCDMLAARLGEAEKVTTRTLELQVKLAEDREDLISRRHARELESQLVNQKQAAFAQLTGDVRAIVPLAVKKLLGVPLTGNDSHGLQDLLATLTPDQIGTVVESGELKLTVGQRQLLASTLSSLGEAEAKKQAESEPKPEAAE